MPAIVGQITILSIGPSSIVHVGDALELSPTSTSKTFAGAGSFNTGYTVRAQNAVSSTVTYDGDIADSNAASVG